MRRTLLASSLLAVLAATSPAGAAAEPRVTANPNPVPFGETLTVRGAGFPVIEFCSRTVRLSLRSDQNAFRLGSERVNADGRFLFSWIPRRSEVGRGDWTLVARMGCESGKDGSPNPVRVTTPIRIGARNLVVGRGRTSKARWTLYTRRGRGGGACVGIGIVRIRVGDGAGDEGCGERPGRRRPLTLAYISSQGLGTFAYGLARRDVGRIEVTFGSAPPMEARILPGQPSLGYHGRFWVAPFAGQCASVSAHAFDGEGGLLGETGGQGRGC